MLHVQHSGRRTLLIISTAGFLYLMIRPDYAIAQYGFNDGGFDAQGSTLSGYCYFPNCPTGAWSGGEGLIKAPSTAWNVGTPPSPDTVAFIQGNGNISQTFVATASKHVRLTWLEFDRPGLGGQTYTVGINGTFLGTYTSSTAYFQRRFSDYFDIVSGTTYTVSFWGTTQADHSAIIDNVKLASADSQTNYTYDVLGRLTRTTTTGGVVDGTQTVYSLDQAGNRTNVTVSGSPN